MRLLSPCLRIVVQLPLFEATATVPKALPDRLARRSQARAVTMTNDHRAALSAAAPTGYIQPSHSKDLCSGQQTAQLSHQPPTVLLFSYSHALSSPIAQTILHTLLSHHLLSFPEILSKTADKSTTAPLSTFTNCATLTDDLSLTLGTFYTPDTNHCPGNNTANGGEYAYRYALWNPYSHLDYVPASYLTTQC
ncbi:MAG: hypothetical protein Q9227_004289 [Pyrenula ochraceoflavens]